jgi:hypothetical protein
MVGLGQLALALSVLWACQARSLNLRPFPSIADVLLFAMESASVMNHSIISGSSSSYSSISDISDSDSEGGTALHSSPTATTATENGGEIGQQRLSSMILDDSFDILGTGNDPFQNNEDPSSYNNYNSYNYSQSSYASSSSSLDSYVRDNHLQYQIRQFCSLFSTFSFKGIGLTFGKSMLEWNNFGCGIKVGQGRAVIQSGGPGLLCVDLSLLSSRGVLFIIQL